jgi:hypothetical protein
LHLNLASTATLRSRLCTLNSLFLNGLFKHLNQKLVLHLVNVVAPRVNVVQHPVHQVLIDILIQRYDSLANLGKFQDSSVFVVFRCERVIQGLAVFTELVDASLFHLKVRDKVNTLTQLRIDLVRPNQVVENVDHLLLVASRLLTKYNFTTSFRLDYVPCKVLGFWRFYTERFKFNF